MGMKTTKAVLKNIADNITSAARENAFQTVLENTTASERIALKHLDLHPEFHYWVRSTAQMLLDELCSPKFADREAYGAERVLTVKQAEHVRQLICAQGYSI